MPNSHERAKLKKEEARIRDSVLRGLTEQRLAPENVRAKAQLSTKGKLSQLIESNFFWGGVGVLIGSTAVSFSRVVMLFTSWCIVALAAMKVNFFEGRRKLVSIAGNAGVVLLLGIVFFAILRLLPKQQEPPSWDQLVDTSVDRLTKRFPWVANGPVEETKIITVPAVPTPPHTHVGFQPPAAPPGTPIQLPFKPGEKVAVNFAFQNVGAAPATVMAFGAKLGVFPFGQRDDACGEIRKTTKLLSQGPVLQPTFGGFQTEYIELTEGEALALNLPGSAVLCGLGVLQWKDESGKYETHGCGCLIGAQVGSQIQFEGYLFHSGTPNGLWFQGQSAGADRMIAL